MDDVGARMKSNANVVIAKLDATANEVDVPGVHVKGFPTLYFFKGNDKAHPVRYEWERNVAALVEYVTANGRFERTEAEL
jgi:protein disulfide-isomerase A1